MRYHNKNKETLTVLCSVNQEVGGSSTASRVSTYTSFVLEPLPACFTTEQSTVEAFLFVRLKSAFSSLFHVLHLLVFFSLTNNYVRLVTLLTLWVVPPKRLGYTVRIGITETNFGNANTLGIPTITSE